MIKKKNCNNDKYKNEPDLYSIYILSVQYNFSFFLFPISLKRCNKGKNSFEMNNFVFFTFYIVLVEKENQFKTP